MKALTLLLLLISNFSFSNTAPKIGKDLTFDQYLVLCQEGLSEAIYPRTITFDWQKEAFTIITDFTTVIIPISEHLELSFYLPVSGNRTKTSKYSLDTHSKTPMAFIFETSTDTVFDTDYPISFKKNKKTADEKFFQGMRHMIKLYKKGKYELGWVSADMTHAILDEKIAADKAHYLSLKEGYQKNMAAVLTEIVADYPNSKIPETQGDHLFRNTFEIPHLEFPYSQTVLEHDESTGLIRIKVIRKENEPFYADYKNYSELIKYATNSGDFLCSSAEDENTLLEGYYPIKNQSTGEIIAFYNVRKDEAGFEVIEYRTKNIADRFATVLKTFVSTSDLKTINRDLLLPGSNNYESDVTGNSDIIFQGYGIDGFMMIESITHSNQPYFSKHLPEDVKLLKGFKRGVSLTPSHDNYVYLFKVNEKLVFMGIDVNLEDLDNKIMTVVLFKGDDELYKKLIKDGEAADEYLRTENEYQAVMEKFLKKAPYFKTIEETKRDFSDLGYTILKEVEYNSAPNDKIQSVRFSAQDLSDFTELRVVLIFDRSDYSSTYPDIWIKYKSRNYKNPMTIHKIEKEYPADAEVKTARYSVTASYEANSLAYADVIINKLTLGTYFIIAK